MGRLGGIKDTLAAALRDQGYVPGEDGDQGTDEDCDVEAETAAVAGAGTTGGVD